VENEIETVIQIMERTPGHRPPIVGAPTRCPSCGEWGLVDHSDPHASANHCYLCGTEWTLTRRAVAAIADNVTFIDADRSGALFDPDPIPLRSRLNHPSSAGPRPSTPTTAAPTSAGPTSAAAAAAVLELDQDEPASRRPRLRLAFSNGRRVQPAGA